MLSHAIENNGDDSGVYPLEIRYYFLRWIYANVILYGIEYSPVNIWLACGHVEQISTNCHILARTVGILCQSFCV